MNKWHVYEWVKKRFMDTGIVPTKEEAWQTFPGVEPEDIHEGFEEFRAVTQWGTVEEIKNEYLHL